MAARRVKIRGKHVSFSTRVLKDGSTAYYRSGRRVTTPYQLRLARGVLAGLTPAEAVGKGAASKVRGAFRRQYGDRLLTQKRIRADADPYLSRYAANPLTKPQERFTYFVKVSVRSRNGRLVYDGDFREDEPTTCEPATLAIRRRVGNEFGGLTQSEFIDGFEEHVMNAVQRAGLHLCTGDLNTDIIQVWRHGTK